MHLPDLGSVPKESKCALCDQPAKHVCSGCGAVAYCTGDHQKDHWETHRNNCQAYKVETNDAVGRHGVATRTLDAGEQVLTELPVIVGPKSQTNPVCLGCYVAVDCTTLCSNCGWPVCSTDCESVQNHANAECAVFSAAKIRFQSVEDPSLVCPQYECIAPLRLLLSKGTDPDRWENEVKHMEAHNKERKETPFWEANQVNIVDFLRKACRLADKFSEEEIHTACGILDVNCFEIFCPNGSAIRGLYPQTAIMSHCCVANTIHSIVPVNELGEEYRLRLRTSVKVEKGGELFTSYCSSLEPTLVRRAKLLATKHFECKCARCVDPTELGTHLGTLKCGKCDNGVVMSTAPLDATAQWKCTHCGFVTKAEAVLRVHFVIQGEIDELDYLEPSAESIEMREQLFRKYRSVLHPKHSCMTSLRRSLGNLYGRIEGYLLDDLPDILLERKIELCRDFLAIVDVVEPGFTRMRAMALYEMHAPMLLYARSRFRLGVLNNKQLKAELEVASKYLEEALQILKLEDPNSQEGMVALMSEQSLVQLRESINSLDKAD